MYKEATTAIVTASTRKRTPCPSFFDLPSSLGGSIRWLDIPGTLPGQGDESILQSFLLNYILGKGVCNIILDYWYVNQNTCIIALFSPLQCLVTTMHCAMHKQQHSHTHTDIGKGTTQIISCAFCAQFHIISCSFCAQFIRCISFFSVRDAHKCYVCGFNFHDVEHSSCVKELAVARHRQHVDVKSLLHNLQKTPDFKSLSSSSLNYLSPNTSSCRATSSFSGKVSLSMKDRNQQARTIMSRHTFLSLLLDENTQQQKSKPRHSSHKQPRRSKNHGRGRSQRNRKKDLYSRQRFFSSTASSQNTPPFAYPPIPFILQDLRQRLDCLEDSSLQGRPWLHPKTLIPRLHRSRGSSSSSSSRLVLQSPFYHGKKRYKIYRAVSTRSGMKRNEYLNDWVDVLRHL